MYICDSFYGLHHLVVLLMLLLYSLVCLDNILNIYYFTGCMDMDTCHLKYSDCRFCIFYCR